ncbi:MAG: AAA family ATPase, partial [Thermoleophilia bacterium]|nr:AAA family ATPase [Thermoleophilia bacterium]
MICSRTQAIDTAATLAAAKTDPEGFVGGLGGPCIIDEVQRAPELLTAIKARVDRDRRAGSFLLTGSASVLTLPRVADALVGRMQVVTLWPLSQGEIEGRRESFLDKLLSRDAPAWVGPRARTPVETRETIAARIVRGGFPEVVARETDARQ